MVLILASKVLKSFDISMGTPDLLHTPFNGRLSGTNQVSRYQKGETNLDFTEARDSEWQWHLLGHVQVCILLQTAPHHSITGQMPIVVPNQQH